jgi:3-hydroxyisobutyrate dehydrogenase-like beta-hydroxyacid dehydrogenase
MAERIGFLGPGLMGKGIVRNLLEKGYPVTVYAHRDGLALDDVQQAGASVTRSLQDLGAKSSIVCLCVPSSREVEAAVLDDGGLLYSVQAGSVVVDFSTSYPSSTRMLYEKLKARQVALLDAPMTGTPVHANAGELNLMIGGDKAVYDRCLPVFQAIAKNVFHVGPSTHGNVVKLINNFLGQVSNAAVAEALPLAAKAGVNLQALFDVVKVSGGNSRVWEGAVPAICQRNFAVTFELRLAHKDMGYMSSLGRELNVPLPMTNSLLNVLDMAKASGLGRENTNALVKMYEKILGIEVRGMDKPSA